MLNQFKLLRVLQLIAILKESPAKSIQYVAKRIETTERSVYRYIDLIRACGFDLQRDIELELSLKAYLLLNDEYPLTIPYIKYNPKSDLYELKIKVNDLKPIQRFMRGLQILK